MYLISLCKCFLVGRKFDLRVYVLVTSVSINAWTETILCSQKNEKLKHFINVCIQYVWLIICAVNKNGFKNRTQNSSHDLGFSSQYIPLKAWLYRDGFARFSSTRFSLSSIDDQCILFIINQGFCWCAVCSTVPVWKLHS